MMEPLTTFPAPGSLAKLPPLDYRIPRWAPGDLESRLCPSCRAQSVPVLLRPDDLPVGGAAGTDLASGREWVGYRVDLEHLQYLSPPAIVLLARELGLTVEHLETTGSPGLAGIDREPKPPSSFRIRLQEARTAVSLSSLAPDSYFPAQKSFLEPALLLILPSRRAFGRAIRDRNPFQAHLFCLGYILRRVEPRIRGNQVRRAAY
jgi:hypothetical protein